MASSVALITGFPLKEICHRLWRRSRRYVRTSMGEEAEEARRSTVSKAKTKEGNIMSMKGKMPQTVQSVTSVAS
jgi:hypothetical protein